MHAQYFILCNFLVISFLLRWSLSKFVYIMRQLHYSLVVQPLLRNMLDPPLVDYEDSLNNLVLSAELIMKIGHR